MLHYFLPELERGDAEAESLAPTSPHPTSSRPAARTGVPSAPPIAPKPGGMGSPKTFASPHARFVPGTAPATLPVVAVPVGDQDVVRAALLWNLAVEVARHGGRALLLRPESDQASAAWPDAGRGPMGVEVVSCPARDLGGLYRSAVELALLWASEAPGGGLVFVQVPPTWLRSPGDGSALLRWLLLFTTCDPSDVRDAYGLAKLAVRAEPAADVGITVHGAHGREEAERIFDTLARTGRDHLGRRFESYGLLVDDLHVYRAVVERRPIGLAHPQSLAARALHDVAGLLLEDARHLKAD